MKSWERAGLMRQVAVTALTLVALASWTGSSAAGSFVPSNAQDASFGINGIVVTDLPSPDEEIRDLAVQSDGKILAIGTASNGRVAMLRYLTNGALDPSFHVTTHAFGAAVALQSDQKIILAGDYAELEFVLERYNTDGSVDATFGQNGRVVTRFPTDAMLQDVSVQEDGRILAAGNVALSGKVGFLFARYLSDGSPDPSFGSGGRVRARLSSDQHYLAEVAIQPDGKIVANGYLSGPTNILGLVRLRADGALDLTFGGDGKVVMTEFDPFKATGMALQPDGGILSGGPYFGLQGNEFGVVRHLPDGTLDTAFGVGGLASAQFNGLFDNPEDVALQPNGLIVQAGWSADEGDENDVAVAWYNPDGSVYSQQNTTLFGMTSYSYALAVQPDGKAIVAGGGGSTFNTFRFGLVRFLAA